MEISLLKGLEELIIILATWLLFLFIVFIYFTFLLIKYFNKNNYEILNNLINDIKFLKDSVIKIYLIIINLLKANNIFLIKLYYFYDHIFLFFNNLILSLSLFTFIIFFSLLFNFIHISRSY